MARKQDEITREILSKLDVVAEYRALGVDVSASEPDDDGWIPCHAFGREDSNPSAAICLTDGTYKDHGGDGANLTLWDFAAEKASRFPDWKSAKQYYAEKAGVKIPGRKKSGPFDHLEFMAWSDDLVGIWCSVFKPGVTPEAILAFGGKLARYRDQYTVIVLPIRSYDKPTANPVGAVLYNTSGGELPIFGTDGSVSWKKMKTTGGSDSGWVCPAGVFPLPGDNATWFRAIKCEGVSDALAIYSAMTPEQRQSIAILTNASGANEHPPLPAMEAFRGKRVDVIHDADRPGQYGSTGDVKFAPSDNGRQKIGWCGAIARESSECRNVELPYEIEEKHGKDVRDYLSDGHSIDDLMALADKAAPVAKGEIIVNEAVDDPHRLARLYIEHFGTDRATRMQTLVFWRDEFYTWRDCCYQKTPSAAELRSLLTTFIKQEFDRQNIIEQQESTKDAPECRKVTSSLLSNVLQAVQAMTMVSGVHEQPCWLDESQSNGWHAKEVFSLSNGNLHLPSLHANLPAEEYLKPPTPALFSPTSVAYAFDHNPPKPLQWMRFLKSIWPNDQESINCLQEWFGYCLLPDTRHHKMLMIVGVKRSGKGTIVDILQNLIGEQNSVSPKLSSLENSFGLQALVGKTLAIAADVRLSGRSDTASIIENLLSITGEDVQTIDRKYLPAITVKLNTRFVILSNELPSLQDASGAIVSRTLLLKTTVSFLNKEDKELRSRLLPELPGILWWAFAGYERLKKNGKFTEPKASLEITEELDRISSPAGAFISDCCIIGEEREVRSVDIYETWVKWCKEEGIERPGSRSQFFKKLRAADNTISAVRKREGGQRHCSYRGISIRGDLFT